METKSCVARNTNASAEILEALAGIQPVRSSVAANPNTPKEVLIFFANDAEKYVRSNVAENPNTPEEILAILATDEEEIVRSSVAKNLNTPEEILAILATDEEEIVRSNVAKNPNTPATALAHLANDTNNSYASLLGRHSKLNDDDFLRILEKTYEEYQDDEDNEEDAWNDFYEYLLDIFSHLKETVKSHRAILLRKLSFYNESLDVFDPNATAEKLQRLAYHKNDLIRSEVARHPNTPVETLNLLSDDEDVVIDLVGNANTPIETFIKVITKFDSMIYCMKLREELSIEMLKELMSNDRDEVRGYVAIHPNTTCEMLEYLANDPARMVRSRVFESKNLSLKICKKMSTEFLEEERFQIECHVVSKTILSFLANSQSEKVRVAVAQNINTPTRILKILAHDNSEEVRMGVAKNPNTPLATLMQLANVSLE